MRILCAGLLSGLLERDRLGALAPSDPAFLLVVGLVVGGVCWLGECSGMGCIIGENGGIENGGM